MNNDNKPPSVTKFSKYLDEKLQSHLEWPYTIPGSNTESHGGFARGWLATAIDQCLVTGY